MVLLLALLIIALSGIPGLFRPSTSRFGKNASSLLLVAGSLIGLVSLFTSISTSPVSFHWNVLETDLLFEIDGLSRLFLIPLFLVTITGAVYGPAYWNPEHHPAGGRRLRLFFGMLAASIGAVLTIQNSIGFLLFWELMAISGFFLITVDDELPQTRKAGLIYLIATHMGTMALLAMFATISNSTGNYLFPQTGSLGAAPVLVLITALVGFGLKAGILPAHIWLPGAHAAAPSHASALLSGVMIKTGIYGIVRVTSFYAEIPIEFGTTLLVLGVLSGILGVAFALAQHDIKRLLAYHSVENIGIITIGLGLALIGRSLHRDPLIHLAMAGALLHVVNHGLFKSLLFTAAGSAIYATGTREIDKMGGLFRRLPQTAVLFLIGAVAISGLPPLNGFVSEFLIYLGGLHTLLSNEQPLFAGAVVLPGLAIIGTLAVACFVKVYSAVFLGTPRSQTAQNPATPSSVMALSMWPLALVCIFIGLTPQFIAPLLTDGVTSVVHLTTATQLSQLAPLSQVSYLGLILLGVTGAGFLLMTKRNNAADHTQSTWGCGYAAPSARIQYTASSFADTLVSLFQFSLFTKKHGPGQLPLFPSRSSLHTHTPDTFLDHLMIPASDWMVNLFSTVRSHVQNGVTSFYLLWVGLTAIVLLLLALSPWGTP